jgi:hypothetical protein
MEHEYKIVHGETPEQLSALVNEHASQGWELWGNPFALEAEFDADIRDTRYHQAMVRFNLREKTEKINEAAGFKVGVPETPKIPTEENKPIVQRAIPLFSYCFCSCFEKAGDNPECRVHFNNNEEQVSGMVC